MTAAKIPDAEFIQRFREVGPTKLAKELESPMPGVMRRRRNLERKHSISIAGPDTANSHPGPSFPHRIETKLHNGVALVASDCHFWPGKPSVMHRALVHFTALFRPKIVVMNGDVVDGAACSRHGPIGWAEVPQVAQEIETSQDRLHEITMAAPQKCEFHWTQGNHDNRFATRLANVAPEMRGVLGTSLHDHFRSWTPCLSVWINNDVVIKHRLAGGAHATTNNPIRSGKTTVTGHLHAAQVRPFTDYNGTRYGVDTGCIADIYGPQFLYAEDNPRNWRAAFGVLTFKDGWLLMPELVLAVDVNHVQFRGEIVRV